MSEPTILIADDDPDLLEIVTFGVKRAGYAVITAVDGEDALALAREHKPQVAVLDVMMPRRTGLDVTRLIREDESLAGMVIILLTSRGQDVDVEQGFAAGADDYLTKPFSPRELLARVRSQLSRRSVP